MAARPSQPGLDHPDRCQRDRHRHRDGIGGAASHSWLPPEFLPKIKPETWESVLGVLATSMLTVTMASRKS